MNGFVKEKFKTKYKNSIGWKEKMMNKKMTSAIEKITLNAATYAGDVIEPSYINFFYGRNGAGKSTVANAIRENIGIQWHPEKTAADYDVLVYNQSFIDNNFSNYDNLAGVFTVCDVNIKIQEQVDQKTADKVTFEEQARTHTTAAEGKNREKNTALEEFQDNCWDATKAIRTDFKDAVKGTGKKNLLADHILSLPNAVEHDLAELKKMYDAAYDASARAYSEFSRAGSTTSYGKLPGKELMDKIIVSSSDTPFAKFMKALNASDWVRDGHTQFHANAGNKCPYCQQPIPKTFEDDLAACFDAQYQQDINDLDTFKNTYNRETSAIVNTLRANLNDVMPSIDKSLLVDYEDKLQLFEKNIEINNQRITGKVKEPTTIVALEDTDSLLIEIGSLIDDINKQIKANNDVVNNRKTQKTVCSTRVWEHIAFILSATITKYKKGQDDLKKEIDDLTAKANKSKRDARTLGIEIADLNKQVVNTQAAIDSINALLRDSGFQGFWLREKDGVQNTYEVIREDGSIAVKLSEGERNFIAFLYFYHLVRGSHSSDEVKDKIVVIDDPVSSMDSGTLFIVSSIVREMIEVCYNNTDYRKQTVSGNYIKQIFVLTHNVYFHRETTYHQVNRYKSTNFYIIRKSDNVSSIKLCDRKNEKIPTERENYNPIQNSYASLWDELKDLNSPIPVLNVIRQILEYYFLQLCGYEGSDLRKEVLEENRSKFVAEVEGAKSDMEKYHLASSMLAYISNPHGISDGLNYVEDCDDVELYKTVFKLIFEALHQEQHYNMMMGIDESGLTDNK